jgi:hypothetical protein
MKSIMVTYPYFQSLPKGVKMMLLASENYFFSEAGSMSSDCRDRLYRSSISMQPRPWSAVGARPMSLADARARVI